MAVYLYCRVSTSRQKTDNQETVLRNWLALKGNEGINNVKQVFHESCSAWQKPWREREQFKIMMDLIGPADLVIARDWDRLSRNFYDSCELFTLIGKRRAAFYIVSKGLFIHRHMHDYPRFALLMIHSQMYSDDISNTLKSIKDKKHYERDTSYECLLSRKTRNRKLRIDDCLPEIMAMLDMGLSVAAISRELDIPRSTLRDGLKRRRYQIDQTDRRHKNNSILPEEFYTDTTRGR